MEFTSIRICDKMVWYSGLEKYVLHFYVETLSERRYSFFRNNGKWYVARDFAGDEIEWAKWLYPVIDSWQKSLNLFFHDPEEIILSEIEVFLLTCILKHTQFLEMFEHSPFSSKYIKCREQ